MKHSANKRLLSWVIAFLMVFTYVPAAAYATDDAAVPETVTETAAETAAAESDTPAAEAETAAAATSAEITLLDGQISVSDTAGTAALSGGTVTATAAGLAKPTDKLVPNTVTITNTTSKYVELSFDYEAENYYEFSEEQAAGNITVVLAAGESKELTISGKKTLQNNTAVLTMDNFSLIQVADVSQITFNYETELGSVTVNDSAVEAGTAVNAAYETGITMTAAPAAGAEFLGWINAKNGKIISRELTASYKPVENITVEAVFAGEASGSYYLVGNRFIMTDFNAAMEKAEALAYPVVAMMNDVTLTAGKYTVPAGVTFLMPFDEENTIYRETPVGENGNYTTPVAYRTLTMENGAELIVNGEMSMSAKHFAGNSAAGKAGAPFGNVPFVNMEAGSEITVNNGGFLYAYGYIIGEGSVDAKSGATVYEYFQVEDFRGGTCTTFMAAKEEGAEQQGVLPITQYYVQNIEVPLTINYGATEYCYTSMFMLNTVMGSAIKFIGDDTAMFCLKDGFVTKTYDGSIDRLIVEGNGNMGVNPITIDLLGSPVNASMFDLPIGMNITISVNTGNVDMNQDVALLPGSKIVIEEGAACTLGEGVSVYVYDLDQWGNYVYGPPGSPNGQNIEMRPINYAPGKKYDRTAADLKDAEIVVNGELDASRGYLYTTRSDADTLEGGGNIHSTENGVVKISSGAQENTYQFKQGDNPATADVVENPGYYVPVYLLPANLVNENGDYVQTYDVEKAGTYTYINGKWACSHADGTVTEVSQATCDTDGITTVTCANAIPHTYDRITPAAGHDWEADVTVDKAATCTTAGQESIHCSKCDATKDVTEVEALGHDFAEYKVITKVTCTADGEEKAECTRCDAADTKVIKSTGHEYSYESGTPATCTTPGEIKGAKCDVCGDTQATVVIPALGHSFTEYEQTAAPECTAAGSETAECDRCDATDTQEIAASGHKFGRYVDQNDATCTEGGHRVAQCTRCDVQDKKDTPALGHSWEKNYTVDVAADCDTRGSKSKHCSRCDAVNEESVKVVYALGHNYGAWKEKTPSTCVTAGTDERICEDCGHTAVRDRKLADHKWNDDFTIDIEATCGDTGLKSIHCSVCDAMKDETTLPASGHVFEYTGNTATCTEGGTETGVCKFGCGTTDTRETEKLGHDYKTAVTAPSCTENGFTTHTCERCKDVYTDAEVAAKGHKFTQYTDNNDATCTAAGTQTAVCDNGCGEKDTKATAVKAHSYGEWKVVKAAACTEDGSEERACTACGNKESRTVAATGHNWEKAYTVDKAPTCTEEGSESIHCAACDATRLARSIDKLAHAWAKDYTVDKAPTCTEAGSKSIHCTTCGTKDKVTEVAAAGHKFGDWKETKAATCTAAGSKERVCGTCSHKETAAVEAEGHTETELAAVAATCETAGLTAGVKCSVCNTVITAQQTVAATGHTSATVTTPATTAKAGSVVESCTVCDKELSRTAIAKIGKTTIPAATFVYNGKIRKPVPTVKDAKGKKLVKGTDYTVTYKNAKATKSATAKNVGRYTVVVTFKGKYSGTAKKQFVINPQGTTVKKLAKPAKKQIKVTWAKKTVQVTGYEIQYSTTKAFTKKTTKTAIVKKAKTNNKVIKQLKSKKKYWVKVRTYKTVNGVKFYSKWSPAKTIVTK